jgi:glucose/mannose-6-phosphate isomerase
VSSHNSDLLRIEDLEKIDKQGMYKIYDAWPEIAYQSYKTEYEMPDLKNIEHIVFAGMGGSGAIGDVLSAILSKTNIHTTIVKGYRLPNTVDSNTLVITNSISGNTVETLNVLDSAIKKTKKIIAFSDGGKMKTFCNKNNLFHQNIQTVHSPRCSFSRALYCALKILQEILPISSSDVIDSINQIKNLKTRIDSSNLSGENPSLNLAEWIKNSPIIYYPWGLQSAALRFKNSLNENSKTHGVIENVIETCHNGIVGWEAPSPFQPILIQGSDDYIKTKERWKFLKEFFNDHEVVSINGNILSKLMHLIYLLDYTTVYLAIKNEIDPSPIKPIDFIKNRINSSLS